MSRLLSGIAVGLAIFPVLHSSAQGTKQGAAAGCAEGRSEEELKEASAISKANGQVTRDGCVLRIRTTGGERTLTSAPQANGTRILYEYEGMLLGTQFHVVGVHFYEGYSYELVGPRGESDLVGEPVLSPDRHRVVAASIDLYAGYNPNAIEVWNIEQGYPRMEIALHSKEWGPDDAKWVDANTITFTQVSLDENGVTETKRKGARLRHSTDGWSFEPAKK